MSRVKKPFNPFYLLLLLAGTAFALSACAYVVMMVLLMSAGRTGESPTSSTGLIDFLAAHGEVLLLVELGVLAVTTFAAIGTDEFWARRAAARESRQQ